MTELIKNEGASQGKLRKAINYVLSARDTFTDFVEDGRLEVDNNSIERCMPRHRYHEKELSVCGIARDGRGLGDLLYAHRNLQAEQDKSTTVSKLGRERNRSQSR